MYRTDSAFNKFKRSITLDFHITNFATWSQNGRFQFLNWFRTYNKVDLKCCGAEIETDTSKDLEQNDRFGSRVDWVPLYLSMDTCDFILYCANPGSSLYGRIALAIVDKHGQMNVFTCSETDTIENLIDEYREQRKCDGNESIYSDDGDKWIVAYNSPIKKMMRKRRMPMYLYQDPPNTCMYPDG
jgi:hypothetical protein